jgi:hypothetical protein
VPEGPALGLGDAEPDTDFKTLLLEECRSRRQPQDRKGASLVNGKIEQLYKTYPLAESRTVLAALGKKFGPNTGRFNQTVQNGFGARTLQAVVLWKRPGLTIQFVSPEEMDTCSVIAWTPTKTANERQQTKQVTERAHQF